MYYEDDYPATWENDNNNLIGKCLVNGEEYTIVLEMKELPGDTTGYEVSIEGNIPSGTKHEVYLQLFSAIAAKYEQEKTAKLFFDINKLGPDVAETIMWTCDRMAKSKGGIYYIARAARDAQCLVSHIYFKHTHPYWVNERNEALVACGFKPFEK